MIYRIRLTPQAEAEIEKIFMDIRRQAPHKAMAWLDGLFKEIESLKTMPRRCAVIEESPDVGRPLRHLLYGKKPNIYRVIFEIKNRREIQVLRIWPARRDKIMLEGIS